MFKLNRRISEDCEGNKKGQVSKKTDLSYQVARIDEISNLLKDYYRLVDLSDSLLKYL